MSIEPILSLSQLSIRRGAVNILSDIDWVIHPGENWVMLGANGSGKTSLLASLTGYLTPTTGEMSVLSRQYGRHDWRELRCQVGLVSSSIRQLMAESEPALHTIASGRRAVIDYWGKPSRAEQRAAARILDQIECEHIADRPWAVLSQGERQRILIGRALMARPKILILDEPCAGLDPVAREHFLQFLERLSQKKQFGSMILVTHHVEEIAPLFTHALLLRGGRVSKSGPIHRVVRSKELSEAFDCPMSLSGRPGSYRIKIVRATRRIL